MKSVTCGQCKSSLRLPSQPRSFTAVDWYYIKLLCDRDTCMCV